MDLDELSSDDSVIDKPPQDLKVTLLNDSDDSCTPVGSIVFSSPNGLEVLIPRSPETVGFKDQDVSSAPLSPNHVKEGHSQDMPAEGSIFDVSPDLPRYSMRPAGGSLQLSDTAQTPPSTYSSFNDPFFGAPITFAQCHKMPGLDTPMTLPIYNYKIWKQSDD